MECSVVHKHKTAVQLVTRVIRGGNRTICRPTLLLFFLIFHVRCALLVLDADWCDTPRTIMWSDATHTFSCLETAQNESHKAHHGQGIAPAETRRRKLSQPDDLARRNASGATADIIVNVSLAQLNTHSPRLAEMTTFSNYSNVRGKPNYVCLSI